MWETLRKEEIFKLLKTDRRSGITKEQVRRQAKRNNVYKIYKAIQ